MRPIRWLHISDIHMCEKDSWAQDVVLKAMLECIETQRNVPFPVDFILVTGDLAFSGQPREYELVASFLDSLKLATGVEQERIFCIPGNHDISRNNQRLCFIGGRAELSNQSKIDAILSPTEDLLTLRMRQQNYHDFQHSYFSAQERTQTNDTLAYVTRLKINDVDLAIVGLDSSWLSNGGIEDHGKLLIGERQVINALDMARGSSRPPHILLSMAHHPFHVLQEYDRIPTQKRIEEACHFHHCGHLHQPESRTTGLVASGCLTLAAGAAFETRHVSNSFSIIELDLLNAVRRVHTIGYDPTYSTFSQWGSRDHPISLESRVPCQIQELASAIQKLEPRIAEVSHYLSALLLQMKSDFPMKINSGVAFANANVVYSQGDPKSAQDLREFLAFRNVLNLLHGTVDLGQLLMDHGTAVFAYGTTLTEICSKNAEAKQRIEEHDRDAQKLTPCASVESFTITLMTDLASEKDWISLQEHAKRNIASHDSKIALFSRRMLALSKAHSLDAQAVAQSIEIYHNLWQEQVLEASELAIFAQLLLNSAQYDKCKRILESGFDLFPRHGQLYQQIALDLVSETGDVEFRKQIGFP